VRHPLTGEKARGLRPGSPLKIGEFRAAYTLLLVENRNVVRGTTLGGLKRCCEGRHLALCRNSARAAAYDLAIFFQFGFDRGAIYFCQRQGIERGVTC